MLHATGIEGESQDWGWGCSKAFDAQHTQSPESNPQSCEHTVLGTWTRMSLHTVRIY